MLSVNARKVVKRAQDAAADATPAPRRRSRWAGVDLLRRVSAEPIGAFGLALVTIILFVAVAAPWLAPHDPLQIDVLNKLADPGSEHLLGTDHLGRDTLSRVIHGTRVAISIAITSIALAMMGGLMLGMLAGYGPKWADAGLVFVFDSLHSLPMIMLALAMITVLGSGTGTLILVVVMVTVPGYARLVRAQVLSMKQSEHILAERALGAALPRIVLVHILPNVIGPLLILVSMDIPVVIMLEAGLSFLGLGIRPPEPSWGNILNDGYNVLRETTTLVIAGGVPLILATLGFTFLGEALRDAIDPKLRNGRTL